MKLKFKNYAKYVVYALATLCLIILLGFNLVFYPVKYKSQIKSCSSAYGVNSTLIISVIKVESSFNKSAKSNKGAIGLMQIMPQTAKWICEQRGMPFGENMLYSPEFNIDIGTYYMSYLLNKFQNEDTAIVAYNAGEGTVSNWLSKLNYSSNGQTLDKIPYKETENYLSKIKMAMRAYEGRLA